MLRQPIVSTSQPPSIGPMMKARPLQLAQTPMACARSRLSGKASAKRTRDIGTMQAAPRPLTTRPAIKVAAFGASAQTSVPTMNKRMPATKTRRRP